MADERYDISITKEYLIRNKAKLLYISSATYSGDWLSTPHTHYCSELFYVLEGIGQFQVEDNIFPVSANDPSTHAYPHYYIEYPHSPPYSLRWSYTPAHQTRT